MVNNYLSIDIGSQHTRSWLYNNASSVYHLVANAIVRSTVSENENIRNGVWQVCNQLQNKTGIRILDRSDNFILDQEEPGKGIAGVGLSVSAGPRIKTALIGLSREHSLANLRKLANSFYTEETLVTSVDSRVNSTQQLEALIKANPDLIIVSGGTNQGASQSIISEIETIRLVLSLLPNFQKTQIVYAGNEALHETIKNSLDIGENLHIAPNINPVSGVDDFSLAWNAMLAAFERVRIQQIEGLLELKEALGAEILPTSFSTGRMVRYLNHASKTGKGVMALDVGAGGTMIIAAKDDSYIATITKTPIRDDVGIKTCYWSSIPIDPETTAEYMQNKSLHPAFLPTTLEDLAIEHAWTRVRIKDALEASTQIFSELQYESDNGLTDEYEPIILSGESLVNVPTVGQAFLMILDGLCPAGITTFVLDKNQILSSLGTLAKFEPLIPVQVLEGDVFTNLGTVINVNSNVNDEELILHIEIAREEDQREKHEIYKGSIKRFEVKPGTKARFYLAPEPDVEVGMGRKGLGGWVSVSGSQLGVVIDARGKPLVLPKAIEARSKLIRDWLWELGG